MRHLGLPPSAPLFALLLSACASNGDDAATTAPSGQAGNSANGGSTASGGKREVHASRFIDVGGLREGWIYDVQSSSPAENAASGVHVLSNGI